MRKFKISCSDYACSNSMFVIEKAHSKLGQLPDLDVPIIFLKT